MARKRKRLNKKVANKAFKKAYKAHPKNYNYRGGIRA